MYELSELFYYMSIIVDQSEMADCLVTPDGGVVFDKDGFMFEAIVDVKGIDKMVIRCDFGDYTVNNVPSDFKTIINDLKRIDSWLQMKEEANG